MLQHTVFPNCGNKCGKDFLKASKTLSKIFNRNTVNISYCCLKNMGFIISSHNKQILQPNDDNFGYNCRIKRDKTM